MIYRNRYLCDQKGLMRNHLAYVVYQASSLYQAYLGDFIKWLLPGKLQLENKALFSENLYFRLIHFLHLYNIGA